MTKLAVKLPVDRPRHLFGFGGRVLNNETQSAITEIHKVRDTWAAAVRDGDVERLLGLLTEDVVIMHPNRLAIIGKANNRADLQAAFAKFKIVQEFMSDETVVAGDWAFDRGRALTVLVSLAGGNSVTSRSKTLTVLHRDADGAWRIARAIGNLDP